MNWLETRHYALNLAMILMQRLDEPRGFGSQKGNSPYRVSGHWALRSHRIQRHITVPVEFVVDHAWLSHPPAARTSAAFIKREIDWHCSKDGWLCVGLPDEWRDELAGEALHPGTTPEELMDMAATWSLASTDSLISRHLIAARYGIKEWPDEWAQWAHFEEGREEYRRKRSKQMSANA